MNIYFDATWIIIIAGGIGVFIFLFFLVFIIIKPANKKPNELALEQEKNNIASMGIIGKNYVDLNLNVIADKYNGYILKNYSFKDSNGNIHTLDYILMLRSGIYAVTVKDYRGTLEGEKNEEEWKLMNLDDTVTLIPNPILENNEAIKALKALFNKKSPTFVSMAVILNAYTGDVTYEGLYLPNKAFDEIYNVAGFKRYSPTEIKLYKYELDNILSNHHAPIIENKE